MPPVIKVENLSKMYRLGEVGTGTVRDDLARTWAKLRGKEDPFQKVGHVNRRDEAADGEHDYVWALRDINFEVEQGEILGIIGRNGAGKSTLLKLLSRITAPTTGRIRARGRIASLLEVGTGFHPELTGRENIYLNGALLGMTRREVTSRLEEIVEFSGCAKYIDTPVKRYSSGMMVRLGFSVAAHLECEILIVDEVLAVGDAEFQKRCLGKMSDVASDGRTILFVSHNMAAVQQLCQNGIVLVNGMVQERAEINEAVLSYMRSSTAPLSASKRDERPTAANPIIVTNLEIKDTSGFPLEVVCSGQGIVVELPFQSWEGLQDERIIASLGLTTMMNQPVFNHHNRLNQVIFRGIPRAGRFAFSISRLPLAQGSYYMNYSIQVDGRTVDNDRHPIPLTVCEGQFYESGEIPPASHGVCLIDGSWSLVEESGGVAV